MSFRATPLEQLNERIATAVSALAEHERIQVTIAETRIALSDLDARVRACRGLMRREERAFTKFDRITVPALIAGVLGTRDRRRQEEYAQWLQVRQELLRVMAERDQLVERIKTLQARAVDLQDAPALLQQALQRKEAWLRANDRDAMGRLRDLDSGALVAKADLAKISLRLAKSRTARVVTPANKRSVAFNQLIILEQLQHMKMRVLRQLDRERKMLLFDGAGHAEALAMA